MPASGFSLTGNIDINAGGAVRAATSLAQRFKSLSENSRTTSKNLKDTASAMRTAADAASKERRSLADLLQAQEKVNKSKRESLALTKKTRAQADAIKSKASDDSGVAFTKKQVMLGESMARIARQNEAAEGRLNNERLRGLEISQRTTNGTQVAQGRTALALARAQTEEVRQRVALENAASQRASRALRDQIALQRSQRSQEGSGELGSTGTRYALLQASATAGLTARAILGVATAYGRLIIQGDEATRSVVRTNDAFRRSGDGVNEARRQFGALSQEIPITYEKLTEIGTLAGQLGIRYKDLGNFTRSVAQFSAITNVSVEDTATAFGRLNSVVPGINGNFSGLADSIAKVGVNSVATESDIIRVTTQISSVAAQAGFSADQIIGLSGALSSIGVPPELSRGVITRTFGQIGRATAVGGTALEKFAAATGLSASEFRKSWSEDASGTFVRFMTRLNESGAAGESTLRGLGITSVRDVPVLLRLAGAADSAGGRLSSTNKNAGLLVQTLRDAANPANEVAKQFALIDSSVGAKLQLLLNSIGVALREIGATNLGPLGDLISGLTRNVTRFSQSLDQPVKLLGMIDLPFTNGEMLGWVAIAGAIVGALSLIVAGLTAVGASVLLVDQLGQRAFGRSLLSNITGFGAGISRAGAGVTALAGTTGTAASGMTLLGRSASTAGREVTKVNSTFGKFGKAPTVFTRIGGAVNRASDRVASLGSRLGGLAKTFGPELIVAGVIGVGVAIDGLNKRVQAAGTSVAQMVGALSTAKTAAEVLTSIKIDKRSGIDSFIGSLFGDNQVHTVVKNSKQLNAALVAFGGGSGIFADLQRNFSDLQKNNLDFSKLGSNIAAGINPLYSLSRFFTGVGGPMADTSKLLGKLQDGFNGLVDQGKTDQALQGLQTSFKGLGREAVANALASDKFSDVTSTLTTRLQAMGKAATPENYYKLATGLIGVSDQAKTLANSLAGATPAFQGSDQAAGDFIDTVSNVYTGMVDFNTSYQGVLDKVNEAAKRKWVAAGNDIADFKDVATGNLESFYKVLDKQFATADAFQSNVATIMGVIGVEYGKQLETLPAQLVAAVAKGGPGAAEALRARLDKMNSGPIVAANLAKAANDPKIYQAFQDAGGKGAEAFSKALTTGVDIEDTIAQMSKALDLKTVTAQAKIKISGDTVPLKKDGESAVEYLNRLEGIIKAKGDTTIARADFQSAADFAKALGVYITARGQTEPARADFKTAADYAAALTAYITIGGNNIPALNAAKDSAAYIQGLEAVIEIEGHGSLARAEGESDAAYISRLKATISILGDKAPAQKDGETVTAYIDTLQARLKIDADNSLAKGKADNVKAYAAGTTGVAKIDANNSAAKSKVKATQGIINGTYGTMSIRGNNADAKSKADGAQGYANSKVGLIKVDAATGSAEAAINYAARTRTVTFNIKNTGGGSFATGGVVRGPGTGTSDSVPINASNGEYVVRAAQTKKHLALLNRINYGRKGYATGGLVTQGSAQYNDTSVAQQSAYSGSERRARTLAPTVTELSAYDRHLLQNIANKVGFTIAPEHIAQATGTTYTKQSRRGNG